MAYGDSEARKIMEAYDQEHCLPEIYARVASGLSLDKVLREDSNLPSASTFWRWHMDDENIRDNLARARLNGVEALMDESIAIANTPLEGIETEEDADGNITKIKRSDMLGHRKLQIETRFKYAQMIAPRKYGVKVDVTTGGEKIAVGEVESLTRLSSLAAKLQERLGVTNDSE